MNRERALKIVLVMVGLLFSAGVYPATVSLLHANQSMNTETMMLSVYVALGIFLLIAARNPSANRSLIAFTAWSSFAHATVMAVMAFQTADERGELLIAVAVLGIVGAALIVLAPVEPSGLRPSPAEGTFTLSKNAASRPRSAIHPQSSFICPIGPLPVTWVPTLPGDMK
jgi:hypothetical protein